MNHIEDNLLILYFQMPYCAHLCELNCCMLALMDNEVILFVLKSFSFPLWKII